MLLYTSFSIDIFEILVSLIERKQPLNYYSGWCVSAITPADQLLMTLMKLRFNCRDLDLAERFAVSRATVSNVVNTLICALYDEILYEGVLVAGGMPSQRKCRGSMPKSFDDFYICTGVYGLH